LAKVRKIDFAGIYVHTPNPAKPLIFNRGHDFPIIEWK